MTMIPIQELLSRIRWDSEFGKGDFRIGYYDRLEGRIITVSFSQLLLDRGDHFAFGLYDIHGKLCSIPFHRVRTVHKDGELIWQRQHEEGETKEGEG